MTDKQKAEFERDVLVGDVTRSVYNIMHDLKDPSPDELAEIDLAINQLDDWYNQMTRKEVA